MLKKPGVQYDNYQMASGSSQNKQVMSHQMLSKQGGQERSTFQNQVKAGISGIGGPMGSSQYGGAFGPNKQNMYHNPPQVQ